MSYLVCEKCGGYYKLKPGESGSDFDKCNCGGKLKIVESLNVIDETTSDKTLKSKTIDKGFKSGKDYSKDLKNIRKLIKGINERLNFFTIIIGLSISVIVLILASFLFGALLVITGISSIIFYGIITLITMTFIGSFVTGFLGSQHLDDGAINGTILSLILLIGMGLIVGFILFIVIGIVASIMASLSPLTSLGASTAANTTTSSSNPLSSLTSIANIFYGIIGIILTLIAGAGGGAAGVFIKKKFKIPL